MRTKTINEIYFDVITNLCARFPALSPFDILDRPTREVFDLYIDTVIQADRETKPTNGQECKNRDESDGEGERVYSWNATWH